MKKEKKIKKLAERDVLSALKPKSEIVGYRNFEGIKRYTIKDSKTGKVKTLDVIPHK